jgi:hypothetical protein
MLPTRNVEATDFWRLQRRRAHLEGTARFAEWGGHDGSSSDQPTTTHQPKAPTISDPVQRILSLREIEMEVEAEGREWMRRRLEERLQQHADRDSAVFPSQRVSVTASAQKGVSAEHRGGGG